MGMACIISGVHSRAYSLFSPPCSAAGWHLALPLNKVSRACCLQKQSCRNLVSSAMLLWTWTCVNLAWLTQVKVHGCLTNCSTQEYPPCLGDCLFLTPSKDSSSLEVIFLIAGVIGKQRPREQTIVQAGSHFVEKMRCLDHSLCSLFYRPLWHPLLDLIWFLFSFWLFFSVTLGQRQYQKQCVSVGLFVWVSEKREK